VLRSIRILKGGARKEGIDEKKKLLHFGLRPIHHGTKTKVVSSCSNRSMGVCSQHLTFSRWENERK
jgi:hypothetical protein